MSQHTKEPECVIHVCICGACSKRFDIPQGMNPAAYREVVEAAQVLLRMESSENWKALRDALAHAQEAT